MRRRIVPQRNSNAKAEITVGYNVNDDKSKVIQNVKVNVSPEFGKLERSATQTIIRDVESEGVHTPPGLKNPDITLAEQGKVPVTVHYDPTYTPIENPYDPKGLTSKGAYVKSLDTELMKIYRDIIIDNYESVINLIDDSGLIILPYEDLIHIIAVLCEVPDQDVKIQYFIDDDISCCTVVSKLSPIKEINTIKVTKNGVTNDLNLSYNDIYNKIVDEYKISLDRFFVKIF